MQFKSLGASVPQAVAGARNPAYGRKLGELQFDLRGEPNLHCPLMTSLHADVYALQALGRHREGNVIMSAWLRLGYIDVKELAALKFEGDQDRLEEVLRQVKGSMESLINLDELPDLQLETAAADLDAAVLAQALVGTRHTWWHHTTEETCVPLPSWANKPLELLIQKWVKEWQAWETEVQQRPGQALTAGRQRKYNEWLANPERHIIMDLNKQQEAVAPSSQNPQHVALCIHMAREPEKLSIKVQDTYRLLFVRQYLHGEVSPSTNTLTPEVCHPVPASAEQVVVDVAEAAAAEA
ncbi:unnamed protein product, partial [Symbiodinium necroappetens]